MKLWQLIATKSPKRPLQTIAPGAPVSEAVRLFCEQPVGCLLVADAATRNLVGILTHRDIIGLCHRGHADADALRTTPVSELMTKKVVLAHPQDDVDQVLAIMADRHIRHIPVVDGDRVVDVVTVGDVLRVLYEEDELKIRYLSDYLEGTYECKVY